MTTAVTPDVGAHAALGPLSSRLVDVESLPWQSSKPRRGGRSSAQGEALGPVPQSMPSPEGAAYHAPPLRARIGKKGVPTQGFALG